MTDWKALCAELAHEVQQYALDRGDEFPECLDRARAALAEPVAEWPTDEELDRLERQHWEETGVEEQGQREQLFDHHSFARAVLARWGNHFPGATKMASPALAQPEARVAPMRDELWAMYKEAPGIADDFEDVENFARAVLSRWGRPAPAPAEGEVAELVADLRMMASQAAEACQFTDAESLSRAADLLEQRHPTPVSAEMIPFEYWDIDSGARIVSEPSEDGPGGCWVVLNSRLVNPFTEFPTAEAAWDALQAAHALPLPQGEVEE